MSTDPKTVLTVLTMLLVLTAFLCTHLFRRLRSEGKGNQSLVFLVLSVLCVLTAVATTAKLYYLS